MAYALFLGYLTGNRGQDFQTEYVKLLDCSAEQALDLAESAAYKGWIVLKSWEYHRDWFSKPDKPRENGVAS